MAETCSFLYYQMAAETTMATHCSLGGSGWTLGKMSFSLGGWEGNRSARRSDGTSVPGGHQSMAR